MKFIHFNILFSQRENCHVKQTNKIAHCFTFHLKKLGERGFRAHMPDGCQLRCKVTLLSLIFPKFLSSSIFIEGHPCIKLVITLHLFDIY